VFKPTRKLLNVIPPNKNIEKLNICVLDLTSKRRASKDPKPVEFFLKAKQPKMRPVQKRNLEFSFEKILKFQSTLKSKIKTKGQIFAEFEKWKVEKNFKVIPADILKKSAEFGVPLNAQEI